MATMAQPWMAQMRHPSPPTVHRSRALHNETIRCGDGAPTLRDKRRAEREPDLFLRGAAVSSGGDGEADVSGACAEVLARGDDEKGLLFRDGVVCRRRRLWPRRRRAAAVHVFKQMLPMRVLFSAAIDRMLPGAIRAEPLRNSHLNFIGGLLACRPASLGVAGRVRSGDIHNSTKRDPLEGSRCTIQSTHRSGEGARRRGVGVIGQRMDTLRAATYVELEKRRSNRCSSWPRVAVRISSNSGSASCTTSTISTSGSKPTSAPQRRTLARLRYLGAALGARPDVGKSTTLGGCGCTMP